MPTDLFRLEPDEAERLAYAEGYPGTARLFGLIDQERIDAARQRELLASALEALDDVLAQRTAQGARGIAARWLNNYRSEAEDLTQ